MLYREPEHAIIGVIHSFGIVFLKALSPKLSAYLWIGTHFYIADK